MFGRIVRKFVVASGLVAVAGVAAAGALGYVAAPQGSAEVELLENRIVLTQHLGEITVHASRQDLPEVVVVAKRVPVAEGLLADITVTAKRARPAIVEMALVAGVPAGALVQ